WRSSRSRRARRQSPPSSARTGSPSRSAHPCESRAAGRRCPSSSWTMAQRPVTEKGSSTQQPANAVAAAHRPNALVVDLDAIAGNVATVREIVGPATTIFGAVKANGYGFGLPEVAEALLVGGANALSLADPA